jgi:hypothetical protein
MKNYVDKNGKQITYDFGNYGLGDFKYIDQNGDGVVNEKDKVPLGKTMIPEISYGFTLGTTFKNLDFTIFLQGLGNTSMHYSNEGVFETLYSGNYFDYHRTAWTQERFDNHSIITYPALHLASNTNQTPNSFFVMNRAFTRLKNVEFGFTLPKKWCKPVNITNFRIYLSGQNLLTFDNLRMKTLDPEQFSTTTYLSGSVYPVTKMWSIGANVNF